MSDRIRFRQVGPTAGDCTTPYEGEFRKPMEVGELVSIALSRTEDWGYVGIKDNETIFGNPRCEYRKGKLLSELPREIIDRKIDRIQIDAGWTRTDYLLTLEEEKQ